MTNTTHFTSYDGNGNVAALVNAANGVESARYDYAVFAENLRETGPMAKLNPMRFSTQYADYVMGETKYLFRDYTADAGRWRNSDPYGEFGFMLLITGHQPRHMNHSEDHEPVKSSHVHHQSESLNLNNFVLNSPENHIDPLGLISFRNCDAQHQADIQRAWDSMCSMVNDPKFQCCVNRSSFFKLLKRRCAWGNVKFSCKQGDTNSPCAHSFWSLGVGHGLIVMYDNAWDTSRCGQMRCTVAHEMTHILTDRPHEGGIIEKVDTKCCEQY